MIIQKLKISVRFLLATALMAAVFTGCKSGEKASVSKSDNKKQEKILASGEFKELFFRGITKKAIEDYEQANEAFLACLKKVPGHAPTLHQLGIIAREEGNQKYAADYFSRAVESDPENRWYLSDLAQTLVKIRDFEKAAEAYRKLLDDNPGQLSYYYELSNAYIFSGDLKSAVNVYDEMEEMIGFNEQITQQKIKLHQNLGNNKQVEKEILKLIENDPGNVQHRGRLAKFYQTQGDKKKALEIFKELKELDKTNPLIHLSLADYYEEAGKYDEAFEERKAAFEHLELGIDNKIQMLLNYFRASGPGDKLNERSYELLEALEKAHPDDPKTFAMYGDFLSRDNRNKEARDKYRKSLALDSSRFAIWNQLLILNSQLNDVEAMIDDSESAMELFPSQPTPYLLSGLGNLQAENYEKAASVLEQGKNLVLDNRPMELQFYSSLGDAYYNMGNYNQAWLNYERALKIDPTNDYVLNNYAYFLSLRKENLEKARKMSRSTVDRNPNSPTYLDTYGWVLYQSGQYEKAEEYLKKALKKNGSDQYEILDHYGDVQYKLGNKSKAVEFWKRAVEVGGDEGEINKKISTGLPE